MIHADLADTPLASETPDFAAAVDSIADRLREAISPFIKRPDQRAAFAALDAALDECGETFGEQDRDRIVIETLRAIYGDTRHAADIRIIASAAMKRFGKDGRSYQAMGDEFGVTRACVQAHSRRIERRTGIKCRADKKASARAKSAASASGRRRSRTPAAGVAPKKKTGGIFSLLRLRPA